MDEGRARIILLPFKWTDVGTWGSVYEFFTSGDPSENYADGKAVVVEATGSFIKSSNDKKLVALAGLDNVVIVDTDDALLVIAKDKIEKIKDIQKLLAERGDQEYL
jgi:mannose-1-phosphate guanylyltransferase